MHMVPPEKMSQFHVGIAAEATAAALFARSGYDVSVQYGANQPEYDLAVISGERMLKVSVKGAVRMAVGVSPSPSWRPPTTTPP